MAPPRPAKAAPSMYASDLVWTRLMPRASATSSSSRMAIQARPNRESRRRMAMNEMTRMQINEM